MTSPDLIERITRSLAYMLRHQPEKFDLELDAHGWGDLDDVVRALIERLDESVEREDVENAIESGDRPRYEIKDSNIRALYGHSIDVEPGEPAQPPELLYVGISGRDAERAVRNGMRGGRRRFLHLALTEDDARDSGRRSGREYAVITVYALDAWEEGISFYDRKSLFLAEQVPTEFLEVTGTYSDGTDRPPMAGHGGGGGGSRGGRGASGGRGDERHDGGRRERPRRGRGDSGRGRGRGDRDRGPSDPGRREREAEVALEPVASRSGPEGRSSFDRGGSGGGGEQQDPNGRRDEGGRARGGRDGGRDRPERGGRGADRGRGDERPARHPSERPQVERREAPAAAREPARSDRPAPNPAPAPADSGGFGLGIFEAPKPKERPARERREAREAPTRAAVPAASRPEAPDEGAAPPRPVEKKQAPAEETPGGGFGAGL